jgi:hypothetical protein
MSLTRSTKIILHSPTIASPCLSALRLERALPASVFRTATQSAIAAIGSDLFIRGHSDDYDRRLSVAPSREVGSTSGPSPFPFIDLVVAIF